jgi:hypothetical protein
MRGSGMMKKILAALILLSLLVVTVGCNQTSAQPKASSSVSTVVKTVELTDKWQMNQMRLEVKSNDELQLLLKMAPGDQADGYFYLEKGKSANFSISGSSLLYSSQAPQLYGQITSDRFTFTASQSQGTTYTLAFQNSTDSSITLFLELIYPSTGSVYAPVKTD